MPNSRLEPHCAVNLSSETEGGKKGVLDMLIHLNERGELLPLPSGIVLRLFSIGIVVICSNLASFILVDHIRILSGVSGKYNKDF